MQTTFITGMGCLSAAGKNVEETTRRLFFALQEQSAVLDSAESRFFRLSLTDDMYRQVDYPRDGFAANLCARLVTEEALAMAGLSRADLAGPELARRVGVCVGSTTGGTNYNRQFNEAHCRNERPEPYLIDNFFKTNTAQYLARYYGCDGPTMMINNACASGADAIGVGAQWLEADLCDIVICGGVEFVLENIYYGFKSLLLCSPEPCRPFDKNRRGLYLGDGSAMVILEKSSTLRKPLATVLGYGAGSDAYHPTAPHPEGRGLNVAVAQALRTSGLNLTDIDFVNAHGTATAHNDLAEGRWLLAHMPQTKVVATKGYTGHTLGGAGALEAVFTVLSLQTRRLPSSKGFTEVDGDIGLAPTRECVDGDFKNAFSFCLGFGGANTVLCLGRAP